MSTPRGTQQRAGLACSIARRAGTILRDFRGRNLTVDHKGPVDLVTDADRASQKYLERAIREAFPTDGIVAEEDGQHTLGSSGFVWVIDPLDGTTNYVHGYNPYAVSIAGVYEKQPVFGVVYLPTTDEMYFAVKGHGAVHNGERMRVSSTQLVADALVASGFPYGRREKVDALLAIVRRALLHTHGFRRSGAAAVDLCHVAQGIIDGYWETDLNAWDVAAGSLIVEEAGGLVTSFTGDEHDLYDGRTVATNGQIHEQLLHILFGNPHEDNP